MKRQSLYFIGPHRLEIREDSITGPSQGEALVKTSLSAISAGTEGLIYRGEFPPDLTLDATIPSLGGQFAYPLKYGYAAVGKVIEIGPEVDRWWKGRKVFSFQPHQNLFLAKVNDLQPLPEGMDYVDAVFFPSMETAATLLLDGVPLLGERVVVFGQGIVGLLLTALLAPSFLDKLLTIEPSALRRKKSKEMGAHQSFDPVTTQPQEILDFLKGDNDYQGADLSYEISGDPKALDQAIALTGYHGRIIIGSWYGTKTVQARLGGSFHRSRIRLISSQVSSIDPALRGRWTKDRLTRLTWRLIDEIRPSFLISHNFPFLEAEKAYEILFNGKESCLQVILSYSDRAINC